MIFRYSRPVLPMLLLSALTAVMVVPMAQAQRIPGKAMNARAVLHQDDTKTHSVKDPVKKQQTETTYNGHGVVIAERVFLLNDNGDPTQGVIYDGAKNLVARVVFFFDDLGRVVEERCVNARGEVFRRVIRSYDRSGKPMPPQAFDFPVNAPNMSVGSVDFTNMPMLPPRQGDGTAPTAPQQPGQRPQIETPSGARPTAAPTSPPPPAEEKKRRFRLPWQKK